MAGRDRKSMLLVYIGLFLIVETIAAWLLRSGPNLGTFFPAIAGFVLLLLALIRKSNFYSRNRLKLKGLKRAAAILTAIWLVSFILIESAILFSAFSNQVKKTDVLLILGAGLHGSDLSLVLKERLDKGLDYLDKYPGTPVIVSGGRGPGEDITEAEAMERYLVRMGISPDCVFKEVQATSTMENLLYSKKLVKKNGLEDNSYITVITSDFHMFRTKFLAKRTDLKACGITSHTPIYLLPNVCVREYFAVIKSFFLDKY